MALVHGLAGPIDLFAKLEREAVSLHEALVDGSDSRVSDAIFNFSVTALHLRDWISAQNHLLTRDLLSLFANNQELQACRDIANSSKHFQIERYSPTTQEIFVSASPPVSGFGTSGRIKIRMLDGRKFEVQDWVATSVGAWRAFLTEHKILK